MRGRSVLGGIATVGVLLAVVSLGMHWPSRPASAQLGGSSEVTRLELQYEPSSGAVTARFHLASGIALTAPASGEAADRLFQAAHVLAGGNARMLVWARNDKVVSWHLSVP
ncbi:MAG: hypothetical protein R3325_08140 [Thermoanaerobaculia bacterium]|nr:hypothetical protein [Thermoanaerobaculia bacterium]